MFQWYECKNCTCPFVVVKGFKAKKCEWCDSKDIKKIDNPRKKS